VSDWLAYGALVSKIFEMVMRARICRPGSTYVREDRENHVRKKTSASQVLRKEEE
jgi:hypothetical protein